MKLLINIPEEQKKMVDAIIELPPQVENDLISAIRHGTPLPDNATNGYVIKALFSNGKYAECKNVIALHTQFFGITCFDKEWWNAPYRTESEERDSDKGGQLIFNPSSSDS